MGGRKHEGSIFICARTQRAEKGVFCRRCDKWTLPKNNLFWPTFSRDNFGLRLRSGQFQSLFKIRATADEGANPEQNEGT